MMRLEVIMRVDRMVRIILCTLMVGGVLLTLILNPLAMLRVMGWVGFFLYLVFILLHLVFLYPLFAILASVSKAIDNSKWLSWVKGKSRIIYYTILFIGSSVGMVLLYYGIPLLMMVLVNGSFSLPDALESLRVMVLKGGLSVI